MSEPFQNISKFGQALGQEKAARSVILRLITSRSPFTDGRTPVSHSGLILAGPGMDDVLRFARAIGRDALGVDYLQYFDGGDLQHGPVFERLLDSLLCPWHHGQSPVAFTGVQNQVILFSDFEKSSQQVLDAMTNLVQTGEMRGRSDKALKMESSITMLYTCVGLFEESVEAKGVRKLRPRFTFDTPYVDMQAAIRRSIHELMVNKLGVPELLAACGGIENIMVLDFVRDLHGATRKRLDHLAAQLESSQQIKLTISADVVEHIAVTVKKDPTELIRGQRGVAEHLETVFNQPLYDFIFDAEPTGKTVNATMGADGVRFTID